MQKKISIIVLTLISILSLCLITACGNNENNADSSSKQSTISSVDNSTIVSASESATSSVSESTSDSATQSSEDITFTITFCQEGMSDIIKTVKGGESLTDIPAFMEIDGYEVSWDITDFNNVTSNIVVNIVKTPINYTITYNLAGGTNSSLNLNQYNVESDAITLSDATKNGYEFLGWYNADDEKITTIAKGSYGNIALTAKWQAINYSITYILEDGTNSENNPTTFTVDDLPLDLDSGDSNESNFIGWYSDNTYNTEITQITNIGNKELFAKFIDYTEGLQFTLSLDETYYLVSGYTGTDSEVYIAKKYNNKPVLEIYQDAFADMTNITKIVIPNSITLIQPYAFGGCTNLTSITIGSGVEIISDDVFYDCYELTKVNYLGTIEQWCNISFGNEVSNPLYYVENLYINDEKITDIVISNTVKEIKAYAFIYCDGLTSVTIGSSVETIGENAFYYCLNLKTVIIGNNVETINDYAFGGCSNLTGVTIGSNVETIGNDTFVDCDKLVEIYNLSALAITKGSDDYGYLGKNAKEIYTKKETPSKLSTDENGYTIWTDGTTKSLINYTGTETELVIPSGITEINLSAFAGCCEITSVEIPDSVTSIGNSAFYDCSNLTIVIIGDSVETIGENAFYDCSNLTTVIIGDSVETIGANAFSYCTNLTSITIGSGVEIISDDVFYDCYELTKVNYLGTIEQWCNISFGSISSNPIKFAHHFNINNEEITDLAIPNTVTEIKAYAFVYCEGLKSVTLGSSVETIGENAFYVCPNITSLTIVSSVKTIGESAFFACNRLIEVYNLSSLEISSGSTFYGFVGYYAKEIYTKKETPSKLSTDENGYTIWDDGTTKSLISYTGTETELVIPSGITEINFSAFAGCCEITSVEIPDSVTWIGNSAFSDCLNLKTVIIGNSVETIGDSAFCNCRGLTSITIPNSVKTINSSAFGGCYKLVEVYNLSDLTITKGELANGYAGYYAKEIYTKKETPSKLSTDENGFIIWTDGITKCLISYMGTETDIVIPSDITEIYYYAFRNSSELTSIIIGNSVETIVDSAFSGCTGLTSVTIGNSIKTIGESAFRECAGITSVTIGSSVETIGLEAFLGCYKLVEVYNLSSLEITKGSEDNGFVGYYAKDIYTTKEIISKLSTDENGYIIWTDGTTKCLISYTGTETDIVIPSDITEINHYALLGLSEITSVTFENPSDWWCALSSTATSGISLELSNTTSNAIYLKDKYDLFYWKHN